MQTAQLTHYAKNFKLTLATQPTPTIKTDEVLIKVQAAAVNPLDNLIGTGYLRLLQNYPRPFVMGNEVSGIVTKTGSQVTNFKIGDAVYARLPLTKIGAFADFVAVPSSALALTPNHLTAKQNVAIPLTGLTAYQTLHEEMSLQPGAKLLIPGGSGSFGQLAIPIAKAMGLFVIVTGNSQGRQHCLALGADQYLDYRTDNYWEKLQNIDAVIDTLGAGEISHELAVLKQGGQLVSLIAGPNRQFAIDHHLSRFKQLIFWLAGLKIDKLAQRKGIKYHFMFVRADGQQLKKITQLIEELKIVPQIDLTEYRLDDINQALEKVRSGHPHGKVVIDFK